MVNNKMVQIYFEDKFGTNINHFLDQVSDVVKTAYDTILYIKSI